MTLTRAVWAFLLALAAVLGVAYWLLVTTAEETVRASTAKLSAAAIESANDKVQDYLANSTRAIDLLSAQINQGGCTRSLEAMESCLFSTLISNTHLSEVTFTHADDLGFDDEGEMVRGPDNRWQISVFRTTDDTLCTRKVARSEAGYDAKLTCRAAHEALLPAWRNGVDETVPDPTEAFGFSTPASRDSRRTALRSDLAYSSVDSALPEKERRVVITSLQAILLPDGKLSGVVKVGLLYDDLRQMVVGMKVNPDRENDPFKMFICDYQGRLITALDASAGLVEQEDEELRVASKIPHDVAEALASDTLQEVKIGVPKAAATKVIDGRRFVLAFRQLPNTQIWRLGVVGPEDIYLEDLQRGLRTVLGAMLAVGLLVLAGVMLILQAMRRALTGIEAETGRMRRFDFGATAPRSAFADVKEALGSLEQAKTAMRALSRFVPVSLVKQLFDANQEPRLESEPRELSMMFTDIEGFTTLVEREDPGALARWLGDYFEVMTEAVHKERGIVDKFIGDAVMALWNAPDRLEDHAVRACAAALRCQADTAALFASEKWAGRPLLRTRIGLHVAEVRVGHFGAPDRISYTAIGDGVNLAARLEGLNKQYGTVILASEAIYERAKHAFAFRRLDKVAVKGKSTAVGVYELLGPAGARTAAVETYEQALDAYAVRAFDKAAGLLEGLAGDAPSAVLLERCRAFIEKAPPADWDGTLHAESK